MLVGKARDAIDICLGKAPPIRQLDSAAEEALAR
jgi:hypothetical protein